MNMHLRLSHHLQVITIVLVALAILIVNLYLLVQPRTSARASTLTLLETTVNDFNTGSFLRTGLTRDVSGGGDGDGEVRLLTLGISAATWHSDGNVTNLPALQGHAAAQKNERIYVSGGQTVLPGNIFTYTAGVFYTAINTTTDHNLTNWITTTALPDRRYGHSMVAVNNFLYVVGGQDTNFNASNTVFFAPLNPNGSVGAWSSTASLPQARYDMATIVVSGTIYVLGGVNASGTPTMTVYYAKPNGNTGVIASWLTATASLAQPIGAHPIADESAATFNGVTYLIGGRSGIAYYPDVDYAIPLSNGNVTTWTATENLPTNLIFASASSFSGQLYVAGGEYNNGSSLTNTIASNLINADGTLVVGGWANSNVLSTPRQRTATVVSDDGWLYVIEGNPGAGQSPLQTIDFGPTAAAGASRYAHDGEYTSAVLDLGAPSNLQTLTWNATVTNSNKVTMTMQYRFGDSTDLSGLPWTSTGNSAQGSLITNTVIISGVARYIQYHVLFNSSQENLTPVLNRVQIKYSFGLPDLIVANISYPIHIQAGQTYTTSVYIMNQGKASACPGGFVPQTKSRNLNSIGARQLPTSCFFWVELYIDRAPPSGFTDLGNCTLNGQPSFGTFSSGSLDPGTVVIIPIPCTFGTSNPHTFYAMVDSCDNPAHGCSATYGWIFESNETNNVFGPVQSGAKPQFLPFINHP